MKKITRLLSISALIIGMMSQYSCNVTEPEIIQADVATIELIKTEQKEALIIEEILDEILIDFEEIDFLKSTSTCPVITKERPGDSRYPLIITKDFGEGCVTDRGTEKSGKIIIVVDGPWLAEGTKRVISFENYTHRGIAISGEQVIFSRGMNEDGFYVHVIKGNILLERPDGVVVKREIHKRRTRIAGVGDAEILNEWLIEGYVEVSKSNGKKYVMNVKEPLHRIQGCRWYQSGIKVIHYIVEQSEDRRYEYTVSIDYSYTESDDACDSFVLKWKNDNEAEVVDLSE